MKLSKAVSFITAVLLCLSLSGCKELPMEYSALTAEPQVIIVGETLTLPVPLPTEKAEGEITSVTEGITAQYIAPNLTITGVAAGEQSVTIEFSAGWLYKKSSVTIPISSLLPQLEATLTSETSKITYDTRQLGSDGPQKISGITLDVDSTATLTATSPEPDTTVSIEFPDDLPSLTITADGANILINGKQATTAMFTVTVSKEGFRDAYLPCDVTVVAIPVPLALGEGGSISNKTQIGKSTIVPLVCDGDLSVVSDNAAVTATIENGKLKLTGVSEGSSNVTVTAKKENYLDNTLMLTCTVTAAAPPPAPAAPSGPYASLVSEIVKYTNIERANVGLSALKLNNTLSGAATVRAKETATEQSHTRPDGRRGLTAIEDAGLGEYDAIGENLSGASATEDGAAIVARWMASPAHRDAILLPQFKTIGVGVYYDDDMYRYCQLFTGTKL